MRWKGESKLDRVGRGKGMREVGRCESWGCAEGELGKSERAGGQEERRVKWSMESEKGSGGGLRAGERG